MSWNLNDLIRYGSKRGKHSCRLPIGFKGKKKAKRKAQRAARKSRPC